MPTPKSVVKVKGTKKDGVVVTYTSSVDTKKYQMFELARAALRDACKYVKKEFNINFYNTFVKRTGAGGKVTNYKVFSNKNTIYPRAEIGLPHSNKGNKVDGYYAYFQEVGSSKTPRKAILQNAVSQNISKIVEIESQYLTYLNNSDGDIESKISEEEYDGDDD